MDFGGLPPPPAEGNVEIGSYAGCSTEQLDYRRLHGSKRVTGMANLENSGSDYAGLTSARIADKHHRASKRVVGLHMETQVQGLMWQQFSAAADRKATQTEPTHVEAPPAGPPSEDHACRPPPEPVAAPWEAAAGIAADRAAAVRQKMPLKRYGDPVSAVSGFNTRWQPDPTATNGKMGLFMQRNPGYANFETDVSRMDGLATYHRDKGYGSANRSHLCDQVTADRHNAYVGPLAAQKFQDGGADRPPPLEA